MENTREKNAYKHSVRRLIKARAKELVLSGENHLFLIFSLIIIGVTAMALLVLVSAVYDFIGYPAGDIILAAAEFFVLSPLVYGLISLVIKMANGEKCSPMDFFVAFSSFKAYLRSLILGAFLTLGALATVFLVSLPWAVGDYVVGLLIPKALMVIFGVILTPPIAFGCIIVACRMMATPLLMVKGLGLVASIKRSLGLTKGKTFSIIGFALGLLPLFLISAIAVLVPMIIYTAPYLLCVWVIGFNTISENNE